MYFFKRKRRQKIRWIVMCFMILVQAASVHASQWNVKDKSLGWWIDESGLSFVYDPDSYGYAVAGYDKSDAVVVIPSIYRGAPVTGIAPGAFLGQTGIEFVSIPEGVRVIGKEAFKGCSALAQIQIPTSIERVGARAFDETPYDTLFKGELVYINQILYRCQSDTIEHITIPDGTTAISEEAFLGCENLRSVVVAEGVSYIYEKAFAGCEQLEEITFPLSVCDISADAFEGTKWYADREKEVIYINNLLFHIPQTKEAYDEGMKKQDPDYEPQSQYWISVQEGTEAICSFAAAGSEVEKVELPSTLTRIEKGAFLDCKELKSIPFPRTLQIIGVQAFAGCEQLSDVVFPYPLWSIGSYAFAQCHAMTSLLMPPTVVRLGKEVFSGQKELTIKCLFTYTTYIGKLGTGWVENWIGDGEIYVSWQSAHLKDDQIEAFLVRSCQMLPDFSEGRASKIEILPEVMGHLICSELYDMIWIENGWIKTPMVFVRKAVYDYMGIDIDPAVVLTMDENRSIHYRKDGYCYIDSAAFVNSTNQYQVVDVQTIQMMTGEPGVTECTAYRLTEYDLNGLTTGKELMVYLYPANNDHGAAVWMKQEITSTMLEPIETT